MLVARQPRPAEACLGLPKHACMPVDVHTVQHIVQNYLVSCIFPSLHQQNALLSRKPLYRVSLVGVINLWTEILVCIPKQSLDYSKTIGEKNEKKA